METISRASRFVFYFAAMTIAFAGCGEESTVGPGEKPEPTGPDTVPPATINSLIVPVATKSTLALQWISPGDDGDDGQADSYDIRYLDTEITDLNWIGATPVVSPPPKPGGSVEILVVKGLLSSRRYFFCIKTADEAGNVSEISNSASGTTLAEYIAPSPVTDLAAEAISDTEFLLTWTATGDDGVAGTASVYDIRYSESKITPGTFASATQVTGEPVPGPAGQGDVMVVGGLPPNVNYYFAMRVGDEVPNWSPVSNTSLGVAFSVKFLVDPITVPDTSTPVSVHFRNDSADQEVRVTVESLRYLGNNQWEWIIRRHLVEGQFDPGAHLVEWDLRDDEGQMVMTAYAQVQINYYLDGVLIDYQEVRRN